MLEARSLTKYYSHTAAVRHVSFTVKPGEILGYLGPNGAGKSTTVKMLTGLIEPSEGQIFYRGRSVYEDFTAFQDARGQQSTSHHPDGLWRLWTGAGQAGGGGFRLRTHHPAGLSADRRAPPVLHSSGTQGQLGVSDHRTRGAARVAARGGPFRAGSRRPGDVDPAVSAGGSPARAGARLASRLCSQCSPCSVTKWSSPPWRSCPSPARTCRGRRRRGT